MPSSEKEPQGLLDPLPTTSIWFSRLVGSVLFLIGAFLVLGAAGALLSPSLRKQMDSTTVLIYSFVLIPIGAFCCFLGARFALQLHNKYGSLLSPLGWIALGIVFAVIASWAAFTTLATGDYSDLRAVIGAAFLAVCCFVNAFNVRACQCRPESRVQRGPDAP